MNTSVTLQKSPLKFVFLVFALTVPFLLIGAVTGLQLLPGVPVAGLAFVCPALAATLLVYRENKKAGVTALLKRSFDFKRIKAKVWYLPALLLMPVVMVLSFIALRLTGTLFPAPQFEIVSTLLLFVGFFIGGLGEELGWTGYAVGPMQARWRALNAGLVLGLISAVWHDVALLQAHRSVDWIAWWSLGAVAQRVIIVWLYNNAGKSVFIAALFHMTVNLTWQLFPVSGSFYDPRVTSVILAVAAAIIVVIWGPRTLTRVESLRDGRGVVLGQI
jgi:membrane protease YdiL (CAAX protease family)